MEFSDENAAQGSTIESLDDQIIAQVGKDYSQYLNINVTNEVKQFDDSIEGMLTRLDEYLGLVSLIRSDTNLCLETTLPVIQGKSEQMAHIFERIDRLEAFVAAVKQSMDITEEKLNQAEAQFGSVNAIRKMFSNISMPSFLSKNKPTQKPNARVSTPKFIPPEIFKTSDYLHFDTEEQQSQRANNPSPNPTGATAALETPLLPSSEETETWPEIGDS